MNNFISKHFILNYKITYNKFKFLLVLKKKILYNNLSRNFLKKNLKNFFKIKFLKIYGYKIFLKLKNIYDKNKYFKIKKYYNNFLLIEVLILFKKFKNFLKN